MIKLFVSQPMQGKTYEEIKAAKSDAVAKANRILRAPVEALELKRPDTLGYNALETLGESIKLMASADVVFFVKGWELARGCRIEHECTMEYGLNYIEDHGENATTYLPR